MSYTVDEIHVGLAIHFANPELLLGEPGVSVSSSTPAKGPHYFLCVSVDGPTGRWVPMFGEQGQKQGKLDAAEKEGPPGSKWLADSFFYTNQEWTIPTVAAAKHSFGDSAPEPNMATPIGVASVLAQLR